jgi:hypothetical protein
MYLTDHDTTPAGTWMTQHLTRGPAEPAERIILFKTRGPAAEPVRIRRGRPRPHRQGGCVAHA